MKFARLLTLSLVCLSLILVPALIAAEKESPAKEKAEGKTLFESKCASCHGKEAKADTTMAKNMKIRDMHSAEVQKQTKEEIIKIIENGKGKMPAYKSKLTKDQITDLADFIKGLK